MMPSQAVQTTNGNSSSSAQPQQPQTKPQSLPTPHLPLTTAHQTPPTTLLPPPQQAYHTPSHVKTANTALENRLMIQQVLQQFTLFNSQHVEQEKLNQQLQLRIDKLEAVVKDNKSASLSKLEQKLEKYHFRVTQSCNDDEIEHYVELMNLISVRVHNVEYRGMALRDLFLLRRGIIPSMVSALTVQHYVLWLQKRIEKCVNNPQASIYYNTLLKHIYHTHPIMQKIELSSLYLQPTYFPTTMNIFPQVPPTPVEYHRLLISIAYDLPYNEPSIMPLITHMGLPIVFPSHITDIDKTTQDAINEANKHNTKSATSPAKVPPSPQSAPNTLPNSNSIDQMIDSEPTFYVGYSTHVSSQLYHPLWFGILSRPCFQDELMQKTPVTDDSFAASPWFSTLCRFGYLLDQFVRVATSYPLDGFYPAHHAYSTFLARFFGSAEDSLTNPATFPRFGAASGTFGKLYSFILFIAAHLGTVHGYEQKYDSASNPASLYNYLDSCTYPYIRDIYCLAMKQRIDLHSLIIVLRNVQLYNFMTPQERSKSLFTRYFGIFHFKIGALSWLCNPALAVQSKFTLGSIFENVCNLHTISHLERYFDRDCTVSCCDKTQINKYNASNPGKTPPTPSHGIIAPAAAINSTTQLHTHVKQ